MSAMDVVEVVTQLGGTTTRRELLAMTSRADVDRALRSGRLLRLQRGRYALPQLDFAVRKAHQLGGLLCRQNAALHHGWAVKRVPYAPHISIPKKRKVVRAECGAAELHRDDLRAEDIDGIATSKRYTLAQCLRHLPFDSALTIADSYLRAGESAEVLADLAATVRGPGSRQVRRVAAEATVKAANPFESVLRAIALDVAGLDVTPQLVIQGSRQTVRPDLVDERLRLVLEADSFEWHGGRESLQRDARRYNLLVVDGWLVLRFAWEDVMDDADYVRSVIEGAVHFVAGRTQCRCQTTLVA